MEQPARAVSHRDKTNRRSFLKKGVIAAGAATVGTGLLGSQTRVLAQGGREEKSGRLTRGDAALLRFAAAAEILEIARMSAALSEIRALRVTASIY